MDNGAMFGDVTKFTQKKYFKEHKTGTLYLSDKSYTIEIFAVMKTDAANANIYSIDTIENEQLLTYLEENANRYRDIGQSGDDTIVALSTCSESVTNGRVVVFGRLTNEKKVDNGGVRAKDEN